MMSVGSVLTTTSYTFDAAYQTSERDYSRAISAQKLQQQFRRERLEVQDKQSGIRLLTTQGVDIKMSYVCSILG